MGGVWNGFLLGKANKEDVPCRFCGKRDGDGPLFWECTFLPCCMFGSKLPEFVSLMALDRCDCFVVCCGITGCLDSAVLVKETPWAASFGQLACCELERRLGAYPVDASAFWTPPEYWDADDIALEMSDAPNIWTGGRWEGFSLIGGFEVAGAGVCVPAPELAFECAVWECGGGVWRCSSGALPCFLCLSLGHADCSAC